MSGYIRQVNASDGSPITAPTTVVLGVQSFAVYANDAAFETDLGRSGQAGDAYFNSTDQQVRYYKDGAWEYHEADESVYDNATSGLTATDVQAAIDEVEARVDTNETDIATAQADIIANTSDIADIRTTQGTSDGDTNLGTFTGSIISDNGSVKAGMQELETAHEAHTGATSAHGATGNLFGLGDDPSFTSTGGIKMPAGTTAQRPTPADGHIRYNSELEIFEGYKSGAWGAIGGGGGLTLELINAASSPVTAELGKHYLCDTSAGAITVNLPTIAGLTTAEQEAASIAFSDCSGTWNTNSVTLTPFSGDSIDNNAADETYILNIQSQNVKINRSSDTAWCLDTNIQPQLSDGVWSVGDVRNSLLTEAQFQSINGLKWVLMDGQSVAGSLYEAITGNSNVPDAAGRFLRMAGGAAAALGAQQDDATALNGISVSGGTASGTFASSSHTHNQGSLYAAITQSGGNITNNRITQSFTGNVRTTSVSQSSGTYNEGTATDVVGNTGSPSATASVSSTPASISSTDSETRPINVTVNYFIKIN